MKTLVLIFALLSSNFVMANPFTYDIQQAGYDFDQYDLKGKATFAIFKEEFNEFPWQSQVGKSRGGTEATISVKNSETNIDLWVSVIGSPEEYAYLIGIVQPKKAKQFFGLGKEKEVRWVTAYFLEKSIWVEEAFELYFSGNTEELKIRLSRLQVFLDQRARD